MASAHQQPGTSGSLPPRLVCRPCPRGSQRHARWCRLGRPRTPPLRPGRPLGPGRASSDSHPTLTTGARGPATRRGSRAPGSMTRMKTLSLFPGRCPTQPLRTTFPSGPALLLAVSRRVVCGVWWGGGPPRFSRSGRRTSCPAKGHVFIDFDTYSWPPFTPTTSPSSKYPLGGGWAGEPPPHQTRAPPSFLLMATIDGWEAAAKPAGLCKTGDFIIYFKDNSFLPATKPATPGTFSSSR